MRYTTPFFVLFCALGGHGSAQPAFDCTKADGAAETLICEDAALAVLDQRLSETYTQAVTVAGQLDAGAEDATASLRAMQRGWIKGRNDCWKADDLRSCVENAYLDREGDLVATWMLREPTSVVSYACGGNPANEVTAFFFDTERPSVRVEYGDGIKAGSQQPAASGAKYQLGFGASFWTKGEDAQFAWVEGEEQSCVVSN